MAKALRISRSLMSNAYGAQIELATMHGHIRNAARDISRGNLQLANMSLRFALGYASRLNDREAKSKTMIALNRLRGYARRNAIVL